MLNRTAHGIDNIRQKMDNKTIATQHTFMTIEAFRGDYRFLSNFWPAVVLLDGVAYPTVENAYQASKTAVHIERAPFQSMSPADAKRAGKTLSVRRDFEQIKIEVMRGLLSQKFRHPDLGRLLLATGICPLIEGNMWGDRFWGVCRGEGQNHLGRLLMQIRAELADATGPGVGVGL